MHWLVGLFFHLCLRFGYGRVCSSSDGVWVVDVPFAEAARWAGGLRRLRLVAQMSGVKLPGPKVKAMSGEEGLKDWGGADHLMVEPILYGVRSAVLALEGCEEGRTEGACPPMDQVIRILERLLKVEKHVVDSYDFFRQRIRDKPMIPQTWSEAVTMLAPGGDAETALRKLGSTRVDLRKSDLNGASFTCNVRLPPSFGESGRDPGVALRNGLGQLPLLGFGTGGSFWESRGLTDREDMPRTLDYPKDGNATAHRINNDACVRAIGWALDAGYRYLDTAQDYGTQRCLGAAVAESSVPRDDIWIATKLSRDSDFWQRGTRVRIAFEEQLKELDLERTDIYLQHHSSDGASHMRDAWRMMEEFVREGLVRVLGASSHGSEAIGDLERNARKGTKPAVLYEKWDVFHRSVEERNLRKVMGKTQLHVVGTGAVHGTPYELSCSEDPVVKSVARRVERTPAQVCLRFVLQNGLGVIVKSRREDRIHENAQIFDFELPDQEMQVLNSLAYGVRASYGSVAGVDDALGYSAIHEYAREEL